MNRTELVRDVYESLPPNIRRRVGQKVVRQIIDETFDSIIAATLQGEPVELRRFATFRPLLRAPHRAFSGKERNTVMSRPYIKIVFSASKAWKRALATVIKPKRRKTDDNH